jgi:hypothetical protein
MPSPVVTTAAALKAMTDRGRFELLLRAVFEIREPKYRALISTGINEAGESIAAPIDAFGRIPSTASSYAMLEATTTDRLRTKWLTGTTKEEADLVKAAAFAEGIRKNDSTAEFTVVLATNQRIPEDLLTDVHTFGVKHQLTIDPWDNSRIAAVLDTTPEGQSVRQRDLGIVADILSDSLMQSLCESSLRAFAATLFDDPSQLPAREAVARVLFHLRTTKSIVLPQGDAGSGKSTIAYHAMKEWIFTGGFALWATADQVARNGSLESLLNDLLANLHPTKLIDGADTLLQLLGGSRRLLIVIDDLRYASNAAELLQRLMAWSRPPEREPVEVVFVVPVRPQLADRIASYRESSAWTEIIDIGRLTRVESVAFLRTRAGVDVYVDQIAERLGDDPFVVGSYVRLVRSGNDPTPELADDVLAKIVRSELTAVASDEDDVDAAEIEQAIIALARAEMKQRRLTVRPADLVTLLSERERTTLHVALRSRLFRQRVTASGTNNITFAHDRLQEHFFARVVADMFAGGYDDVLSDPFFARVVGMELAKTTNSTTIARIVEISPLGVFEAFRFVPENGAALTPLRKAALHYLETVKPHAEMERAILEVLFDAKTDVLALARLLPDSWLRHLVLLRHGDISGGLAYAQTRPSIGTRDSLLEEAIARAKQTHRAHIGRELSARLLGMNGDARAALILAGDLAMTELAPAIAAVWQRQADASEEMLAAAVWASARCSDEASVSMVMSGPVDCLLSLPRDGSGGAAEPWDELRRAFSRPPTSAACAYLLGRGRDADALPWIIWMLEATGDPLVLASFVSEAATKPSQIWTFHFRDRWTPSRNFGKAPGDEARNLLKSIWQDTTRDSAERKQAFMLWTSSADLRDLSLLRSIEPASELGDVAIFARAQLRDMTAASALANFARVDIAHIRFAHLVWSRELFEVADAHLTTLENHFAGGNDCRCNDCHWLADLIRLVPDGEAERLLAGHWPGIEASSLFIQTAVIVGTPKTTVLADAAINAAPLTAQLFRHVTMAADLWSDKKERPVTPHLLSRLLKYRDRLDPRQLEDLMQAAARRSWNDWLTANFETIAAVLPPERATSLRRTYYPTDGELRDEFKKHATMPHGGHAWRINLEYLNVDARRALRAAVEVSVATPTAEAWETTIDLIAHIATRPDLEWIRPLLPADSEIVNFFDDVAFAVLRRSLT